MVHFVFSFPKMLRPYFRNNKKVLSEIARPINDMIVAYYCEITDKKIRTGIVLAFQSFGDFLRYNPHIYSLISEGDRRFSGLPVLRLHLDILSNGFDEFGNFIHMPILDLFRNEGMFQTTGS